MGFQEKIVVIPPVNFGLFNFYLFIVYILPNYLKKYYYKFFSIYVMAL